MYLVPDANNKPSSEVAQVQRMLNCVRVNFHHSWDCLNEDGIYGRQSAVVVRQFQIYCGISSQMTANGPVLGDTTIAAIRDCYRQIPVIRQGNAGQITNKKTVFGQIYNPAAAVVSTASNVSGAYAPFEALSKLEGLISQQADNLRRRISKIPKNPRARNLEKAVAKSKEFLSKAKKYGVNVSVTEVYGKLTKTDVVKYLSDAADMISSSKVLDVLKKSRKLISGITNALKPLYNFLNKIPGLKYLGAAEKIIRGTVALFRCEFETAFKYFLDGIREIVESILVDAAVVALIAAGGWLALLVAILLIVVVMIIDYFFFSDNSGESLVDKYTPLRTQNVVQDTIAPWIYNSVNK